MLRPLLLVTLLLLAGVCPAITLEQIQTEINGILSRSTVAANSWTILIQDESGQITYYARNPDTVRRPASNTKLFTTAAAFGLLGPTYSWNGGPLQTTIRPINKNSDNEDADELLRDVGFLRGSGYSFAAGGIVSLNWCASVGVPIAGARMDDGSGLDYDNRFSARQIVVLLRYMLKTYPTFDDTLSVGCVDGTLGSRFCETDVRGRVRGKTGTLTNGQTTAVSGIVENRHDGKKYLFSFIANGVTNQSATRQAMDDCVRIFGRTGLPQPTTTWVISEAEEYCLFDDEVAAEVAPEKTPSHAKVVPEEKAGAETGQLSL